MDGLNLTWLMRLFLEARQEQTPRFSAPSSPTNLDSNAVLLQCKTGPTGQVGLLLMGLIAGFVVVYSIQTDLINPPLPFYDCSRSKRPPMLSSIRLPHWETWSESILVVFSLTSIMYNHVEIWMSKAVLCSVNACKALKNSDLNRYNFEQTVSFRTKNESESEVRLVRVLRFKSNSTPKTFRTKSCISESQISRRFILVSHIFTSSGRISHLHTSLQSTKR